MKVSIFSKRKKTKDGRQFFIYLGKLMRLDGTEQTVSVKFKEDVCTAPNPNDCPMIVDIPKHGANLATEHYVREDTGEPAVRFKLWVNEWKPTGEAYIDHSLDDFAD